MLFPDKKASSLSSLRDNPIVLEKYGIIISSDMRKFTYADMEALSDIYISYDTDAIVPIDIIKAKRAVRTFVEEGAFVAIMRETLSGKVVGGIIAVIAANEYSSEKMLQQRFYVSSYEGFQAARALLLAHEVLVAFANKTNISYILSPSSHMDEKKQMNRILERAGWSSRGYISYLNLKRS